jgi:hypothetical protein
MNRKCDRCKGRLEAEASWYWEHQRVCRDCFEAAAAAAWWEVPNHVATQRRRAAWSIALSVGLGMVLLSCLAVVLGAMQ